MANRQTKSTKAESKSHSKSSHTRTVAAHTRTVAIDLNPATYSDAFDLTTELADNRDFYTGEDCVTLRPVPGYLIESLERYKYSFASHRPGMNAISSACIWGSLQSLRQIDCIKDLIAIQERLRKSIYESRTDDSDEADINRYDMIRNWFKSFPVGVMSSGASGLETLNVSLPEKIKASLCGTAGALSISQGALGAVLIADMIREQDTTLKGHRRKLDESVKTFLILCQARLGALDSVLEMLKRG